MATLKLDPKLLSGRDLGVLHPWVFLWLH